jgi:5'-3' exonuclease
LQQKPILKQNNNYLIQFFSFSKFCTFELFTKSQLCLHKTTFSLLDAYALIFRGYYAFIKTQESIQRNGHLSHYGVYEFLMDVIKREKPDHLAVAFDKGGSQLRNDIFPEYKAHRDAHRSHKNSSSLHSGFTKSHAHSYYRSCRL